ncbi:hypothetical protein [Bacillus halotolerans]|uniref:hypothetical protein n=1 Tax=Bacillus halotolerans TaxID=260554 RepID=UPI0020C52048|nr:hypothetical protein [Bacillus halotolerans]UTL76682.1 hypothetical protein NLW79_21515 [Bacillus halotolerans]WPC80670.1 hypothetical protein RA179_21125 [Bacillus halotolerans]
MDENFYNNPLKVIWNSRKNLMPNYLIVLWILFLLVSLASVLCFDFMDFSSFQIGTYFSVSSTGLTLTLALFVAGKNAFSENDLKTLAQHEDSKGVKGQALIDFLGPFVFTALLFLVTGLLSLFGPYINLPIKKEYIELIKVFYINILFLGLLSLFNLVITMLNDVYASAFRK